MLFGFRVGSTHKRCCFNFSYKGRCKFYKAVIIPLFISTADKRGFRAVNIFFFWKDMFPAKSLFVSQHKNVCVYYYMHMLPWGSQTKDPRKLVKIMSAHNVHVFGRIWVKFVRPMSDDRLLFAALLLDIMSAQCIVWNRNLPLFRPLHQGFQ